MAEFSIPRRDLRRAEYRARRSGFLSRVVVVGKVIVLCGGHNVAIFGGSLVGIGLSETAPYLAWFFVIGGIVCGVACLNAMVRVANAAPWLPEKSMMFDLFICISGFICAVVGCGVMLMLIGAAL